MTRTSCGLTVERCGDLLCVFSAGGVFIGDDAGALPAQRLGVFAAPFAGAADVTRRDEAIERQAINILLAFRDEDPLRGPFLDGFSRSGRR